MLKQVSWTTTSVEQGHASATLVHRFHSEYNEDILLARAVIHSARNLLPDQNEERRRDREDARSARLERKAPQKISGFNMLFKDMMSTWSDQHPGPVAFEQRCTLMTLAHAQWRKLTKPRKDEYRARAVTAASEKAVQIAAETLEHKQQVMLRRQRLHEERSLEQGLVRLGSCRWSHADLEKMAAMSESKYFAAGQVSALREAATAAVEAPCSLTLETLAQVEPLHIPEGSFLAWAAHVCEAREHFRNAASMIQAEASRPDAAGSD